MKQVPVTDLKPGDVIAVEHTPASWTRSFADKVFRVQANLFYDPLRN